MDHGSSGLVTIQLDPYVFLTQNYIRLESNSFRARSLDNVFQILNFFIYHPSSTPYQYNPEDVDLTLFGRAPWAAPCEGLPNGDWKMDLTSKPHEISLIGAVWSSWATKCGSIRLLLIPSS